MHLSLSQMPVRERCKKVSYGNSACMSMHSNLYAFLLNPAVSPRQDTVLLLTAGSCKDTRHHTNARTGDSSVSSLGSLQDSEATTGGDHLDSSQMDQMRSPLPTGPKLFLKQAPQMAVTLSLRTYYYHVHCTLVSFSNVSTWLSCSDCV